ncbi:MAG: ABC transporter ATP-binding protein [Methylobacteriaceae bacterium]|nr:ABC transporter ATP-binding protein [Methylobacteriaceae bacterium]
MSAPLLTIEDLTLSFATRRGTVRALEGVSFEVRAGEMVGLVGESGSGKSVTAYAAMGLLDASARIASGRAVFAGRDLLTLPRRELDELRGRDISMVFQNPRAALNPIRPVGRQIADVLARHAAAGRAEIEARTLDALRQVRIADPERRARALPHELSGGMCQRVGIAMALACRPKLLIADEPTTGLDVTTQAVVMDLLREAARANGASAVLITHDLALAAEYCERIVVMHAGHVVETAPVAELFGAPRHPYTGRLLASAPSGAATIEALTPIAGALPDLRRDDLPPCRFAERCERRAADCAAPSLRLEPCGPDHRVACRHPT